MDVRLVNPTDIRWEQDHAVYRVYFWNTSTPTSYEHEITGADIEEVLAWTHRKAQEHGWRYTIYVKTGDRGTSGTPGLVRLTGVLGDPFADMFSPEGAQGPASFTISIGGDSKSKPDEEQGTGSTGT